MALTSTPVYVQQPFSKIVQFTSSTSTSSPTLLLAATTNGCKLESILIANTDTTNARTVAFYLYSSLTSTNYQLTQNVISAGVGGADGNPLELLGNQLPCRFDTNGNPYLYLDPNTSLYAEPTTSLTSGKFLNFFVFGAAL